MKNTIYIIVIVVCFLLAAVIAYKYIINPGGGGGGLEDIPADEMTWVKCTNPDCKAEYQMGLREYYKQVKERASLNPLAMAATTLICEKCGEPSVLQAVKCGNPDCGIIFVRGSVPGDHDDRCPKCKYSETEEIRKKRKAGGQ